MTATLDRPTEPTPRHRTSAPRSRRHVGALAPFGVVVLLGVLLLPSTSWLGLRPLLAGALLVVPVVALVRRVRWLDPDRLRAFLVSAGLVLLAVLLLGLLLNTTLPSLGVERPLARPVVVVAVTIAVLALLCWRPSVPLLRRQELADGVRRGARLRLEPAVTTAVVAVVATVTGAVRLNNDAGAEVSLFGRLLVLGALTLLFVRAGSARRDAWVVYLSSLSLLLATSLRSWYVVGHDIQQEYAVYLLTQGPEHWAMSAYPSAYNACLSLNILPVTLVDLTGLSGVLVFKVVVPLLFALVPLIVYAVSRTFVGRRTGLVATVLFASFPTFSNDMTFLVRQEIAFLFLALAGLVALHHDLDRHVRRALVVAFGVGVVLSHYSTTYVMLLGLLVGLAGLLLEHATRRRRAVWQGRFTPRDDDLPPPTGPLERRYPPRVAAWGAPFRRGVFVAPLTFLLLAVATYAWVGPATHSGGHLGDTLSSTARSLIHGDSTVGSSDLAYGLFARKQATPQQRLDLFVEDQQRVRDETKAPWLLSAQVADEVTPKVVETDNAPLTALGRDLEVIGIDVGTLNALLRLGAAALIQLWLAIGVVLLLLGRGPARRFPREAVWLAVGSLGGVGLLVVLPGLSADYGVLRAFQQSLLVTAPVVALGALWSVGWLGRRARPLLAGLTLFMTLFLTGAMAALTGGFPGVLALANSGQYHDLFYVSPQQRAGEDWVARTMAPVPPPPVFAADGSVVDQLTIETLGHVPVRRDFFPSLLRRGEWLFLSSTNVTQERASTFYTGNVLTYRYPVALLQQRHDVVYSGPGAQVLR